MSDQLLPVAATPVNQENSGVAAKSAAAGNPGGIANDFMLMLLHMIPAATSKPGSGMAGATSGLGMALAGTKANGENEKSGTADTAGDAKKPQASDAAALLNVIAAMQGDLMAVMQNAVMQQGAQAALAAAPAAQQPPGQAESAPAQAAAGVAVIQVQAGTQQAPEGTAKAPVSTGSPAVQKNADMALVDLVKQMDPVNEPLALAAEPPAASLETAKDAAPAAQPSAPKAQPANVVEEAVVLNALNPANSELNAKTPAATVAAAPAAKGVQGKPADPIKSVSGDGLADKADIQKSTGKSAGVAAPAETEHPAAKAVRTGPAKPKVSEDVTAEVKNPQAMDDPERASGIRTASVVREPAAIQHPRVSPAAKAEADQQGTTEARADKTILPQGASVAQSAAGSNAGDSLAGKAFGTVLQQAAGVKSGVQQAERSVSDPTQVLSPQVSQGVVDQVVKHMSLQVEGKTSEMRMTLKPESLGEVVVQVRMDEGKMHAQIDVGQASVKTALESNLPQLRQALAERGIDVQRIDVFAAGQSSAQQSSGGQGDRPRRQGGNRRTMDVDAVEQYQASRQMGYNTMEIIM